MKAPSHFALGSFKRFKAWFTFATEHEVIFGVDYSTEYTDTTIKEAPQLQVVNSQLTLVLSLSLNLSYT